MSEIDLRIPLAIYSGTIALRTAGIPNMTSELAKREAAAIAAVVFNELALSKLLESEQPGSSCILRTKKKSSPNDN